MGDRGTRTSDNDRTARAVATQLQAIGCATYEIGVCDAVSGQMMTRTWSANQLEQDMSLLKWLRHENAQNSDIYIRPAGSLGLIFGDDLTAAALDRLRHDGLAPAAVIETSPENFQVWLRVSDKPISPELATAAARIVAERYGGDPNSADWRHFGRLAGFTNRKPKRARADGKQPYVLVREARGSMAERAGELLAEAEARRQAAARSKETPARAESHTQAPVPDRAPGAAYRHYAARYSTADSSRLDWSVCKAIACAMLVDQTYLEQAMLEGSPDLSERKAGHVEDYVARTARKVLQDPDVVEARERLAQRATAQQRQGLTP